MGLTAAMQQLQQHQHSHQPQQQHPPRRPAAVLEKHAAATGGGAAAAVALQSLKQPPQAFYMQQHNNNNNHNQQQWHGAAEGSLHTQLGRVVLQRPTKPWQQQEQNPVVNMQPQGPLHAAAAAANASTAGLPHIQQQQQRPNHAELSQAIAACTSLHQLQRLFPQVAAAALPELTTVLLLQAVTIVRSSSSSSEKHQPVGVQDSAVSSSSSGTCEDITPLPHLSAAEAHNSMWPAQLQQSQQQSEQQQLHSTSEEVQQLLLSVNSLLERQCPLLQFQHISGVLWAWSQLGWRPAEGNGRSVGLRSILRRLVECPVGREQSGQHTYVGPQLARLVVGCAALNIRDPHVWRKLYSITQGAAAALGARDLAHVAWGFARSHMPHTPRSVAAWSALLSRAHVLAHSAAAAAGGVVTAAAGGFDVVAALNLLWAMVSAQVSFLAPAGLMSVLVQQALGHRYNAWCQQQQLQRSPGHSSGSSGSSSSGEQETGRDGSRTAAASNAVAAGLLPHELSCLVWTLASATKQQQRLAASHKGRQLQQQQQGVCGGPASNTHPQQQQQPRRQQQQQQRQQQQQQQQRDEVPPDSFTPLQLQQLQQLKEGWSAEVLLLLQDQQLQTYLAAAVRGALQELEPPQLAQLAYAGAVLSAGSGSAVAAAAAAAAPAADGGGVSEPAGFDLTLVQQLWSRSLRSIAQDQTSGSSFGMVEWSLLLQSVATVQRQQRQQPAASSRAVGADVVAAAVQHIQSSQPSDLQPRTAVVLLHHLACLHRAVNQHCSDSSRMQAAVAAAVSATAVLLVDAVCAAGGINRLKDHELVLAAVAVGQLATAATPDQDAKSSAASFSSNISSSGSERSSQAALQALLQQLALPLAATAPLLKLRSLANIACAYAAAGLSPPELFDAVADAVQDVRVLDQGSGWALARTLAAYAAVGYVDEGLFAAVADALSPRLQAWVLQPRVVSKLAGALAAAGCHDKSMFRDIAAAVLAAAAQASAAGSTSSSTSSSTSGASSMQGMEAPASEAAVRRTVLQSYQPQDVSVLCWALATAGFKDPRPYKVLAAAGVELLPAMSTGHLANLLWGCAAAGVYHEPLVAAVLSHLAVQGQQQQGQQGQGQQQGVEQQGHEREQVQLPVLTAAGAADVATIAWSLAKLHVAHPAVLAACAQHFIRHSKQYSPADAADLAWALAWQGLPQAAAAADTLDAAKVMQQQEQRQQQDRQVLSSTQESPSSTQSNTNNSGGFVLSNQLPGVLQQLLHVCLSDVDQLSPQQLADMCLVSAAHQAGCLLLPTASCESSIEPATSSSSSVSQQLWSCVTSWGPNAFTAADGAKLLWASLLTHEQQQQQQDQQQYQHQSSSSRRRRQGGAATAGVAGARAKLLGAGARALVQQTAAVCGSAFCAEVLAALHTLQFQAVPCIHQPPQQPPTAGNSSSQRATKTAPAVAAATAAAAAAAAAVTRVVVAYATTPHASGSSSSNAADGSGSSSRIWSDLGPAVAAQLLGHIVVDAQQPYSGSIDDATPPRPLLLHLVPADFVTRSVGAQAGNAATAVHLTPHKVPPEQRNWRAVVTAHVLQHPQQQQRQPHYVGVVLTEQQWVSWGDQQLQKLQELLGCCAAAGS